MRQDQLLDVGVRGDGSDDGRRHMETAFQSGGIAKDENRHGAGRDAVGLQFVAALRPWFDEIAQVAKRPCVSLKKSGTNSVVAGMMSLPGGP